MTYLTKSRFKLALSCPTKLYYNELDEYENIKKEDKFLEALAEGGYQVGELAKCYFPDGHDIKEKGYELPLSKTNELLLQENVIIYEAAIKWENCFVRVDILKKTGNHIELIEVKAKSFSGSVSEFLTKDKNSISSGWREYLEDVAFQKYVVQNAFPECKVTAFLMLADKTKRTTIGGLNQKFFLKKDGKELHVIKNGDVSLSALGEPILTLVNVDEIATGIINDIYSTDETDNILYREKVNTWASSVVGKTKIHSPIGVNCFGCQFQRDKSDKKSGFNECWSRHFGFSEQQLAQPLIKEIWNFKGKKKLLEEQIVFVKDVQKEHFGDIVPAKNGTLSLKERQWMQVQKIQDNDDTFYLDVDGMRNLINTFTFPLHFIDFETSMSAIPFYANQKPYETIAFQFSHHLMYEDGKIEHKSEYIKLERGEFPNFEFIRELKKVLNQDNGTIFRFATHENTVLNHIAKQLMDSPVGEISDKDDLLQFIYSITYDKNEKREGERNMVDMCQMVKDYYYDPRTKGSNSIKAVLPSVLSRSEFLQTKYSQPIYGKNSLIKSINFEDGWSWIQKDEKDNVVDPYKLLPKLFNDVETDIAEGFITEDSINSGGAALTAFAKIQFMEMSDQERQLVINGLLKYCELDTLAMVMIFEHWKHLTD
jgi:hypothetical protein